uniref:Glycosyl transferase WecB/TagA/CpsF n=1 Tax=Paulinella chromatophora TaxID=39717 RepID=B1X4S1_PAUCH|nr:Glycosyl transferase WecB/TagA/CpsF [Paulinella chromatophora]ACB42940.1 Glycosyl transferase WecB/TagA/CpsF [Paulinella chromatophora]
MGKSRTAVLGIRIDICRNVIYSVIYLHHKGGGQVVTLNAEMIVAARTNFRLKSVIENAQLVIPDGAGVVWALAKQGIQTVRSPGIETGYKLLEYAESHNWKTALIGSSPEVIEALKSKIMQTLPNLHVVLMAHGYQSIRGWTLLEKHLSEARPDLILVALGVPRQETWIQQMCVNSRGIWMGVGGSFDIWSGTKKRAPNWVGALRIEWLYRLIQEPSRWRRMLALPVFVWEVMLSKEL